MQGHEEEYEHGVSSTINAGSGGLLPARPRERSRQAVLVLVLLRLHVSRVSWSSRSRDSRYAHGREEEYEHGLSSTINGGVREDFCSRRWLEALDGFVVNDHPRIVPQTRLPSADVSLVARGAGALTSRDERVPRDRESNLHSMSMHWSSE